MTWFENEMTEINEVLPEHIGREVRKATWKKDSFVKVLAVYAEWFWAVEPYDDKPAEYLAKGLWLLKDLPAPDVKPSERIKEIKLLLNLPEISKEADLRHELRIVFLELRSIHKFLDELHKEGKI